MSQRIPEKLTVDAFFGGDRALQFVVCKTEHGLELLTETLLGSKRAIPVKFRGVAAHEMTQVIKPHSVMEVGGPDEIPQAIAEELRKWMDGYYDAD